MKFPLENETIRQEKYRALVMTKNTPNLDKAEEIIKKALGSLSDCLMPITEYREDIKTGCIIDYDGFGEYYDIWGTKRGYSDFNLADFVHLYPTNIDTNESFNTRIISQKNA